MTATTSPPLVLLHGVGLDRTMWAPFIEATDLDCVALDLPGHGAQPPLRSPQTLASLAADVESRLPEGPVHLVGFSLGALIAQHIARFSPDRIRTLSCVSSVCLRTPAEAASVERRLASAREDFPASAEASIERWYPEGSTVPRSVVEATHRTLLANDVESYLHAYAVFARGDREIGPELGTIPTPTLAITGELDHGSTPEMSYRLEQEMPVCRAQIVAGARHMLPVENVPVLRDAVEHQVIADDRP